jgi:hypothetical protein
MSRIRIAGFLAALLAGGTLGAVSPRRPAESSSRAFLDRYCSRCHNSSVKAAELDLDSIDVERPGDKPEVWEKVVRKLRARYMPPVGFTRPDEQTYDAFTVRLETSLDRQAEARPNPGRTDALHRLNRFEYRNAVRDLLGIEVDVASLLPKDEMSHGFDNVGVGGISPSLLERYLSAAQKISRLAVGSPVRSPSASVVVLPPDLTQEEHVQGLPFGTRGGTVIRHNFPRDGQYEVQLRLTRSNSESVEGLDEPHQIEIDLDGAQVRLFSLAPKGEGQKADGGLRARFPVTAGPHDIGATFIKNPSSLLETDRQPYQAAFNPARHPRPQPALYSLSIVGPFEPGGAGDTPSRNRIFVCRPSRASEEEGCAKTILSRLARRAYRRPVTEADLESPLRFYREGSAEGGFEPGIETALRSILVNPDFLLRVERDPAGVPAGAAYAIGDLELASRLSFFLWSSIPDEELLDTAAAGRLRQPAVREQQVKRMLADSRSQALAASFAGQWLHLRNLDSAHPDPRLFPDFDDNLRQALRRETELFFESVLKEDRSVLELLTAKYTFLNERLAKHYGIPNVYGSRFRRVPLEPESLRGGLLGQGSILTVTSYVNRTSPVLRGKWIMENILGAAPPPPLPNVPSLEATAAGKVLPVRQRMEEHRKNPACAGCHNLMDPLGFATENFDAIGRFRLRDEGGTPIDVSGRLPDGTQFEGMAGLRQAVVKRPELFVAAVSEKLLTYATGRGLEYYDAAAVRSIVRGARKNDYRFSAVIAGIVRSTPFRMRRSS